MLPKEYRLSKKKDFQLVFKRGESLKEGGFILNFLKLEKGKDLKFGFIVSSKVHKKATRRNKLKRRMREAIRRNLFKVKRGYFFVFVALPQAIQYDFATIEKQLLLLLEKANAIKEE